MGENVNEFSLDLLQCHQHNAKAYNNVNNGKPFGNVVRSNLHGQHIRSKAYTNMIAETVLHSITSSLPNNVLIFMADALQQTVREQIDAAQALLRCKEIYMLDEYDDKDVFIRDATFNFLRKALSQLDGTFRDSVDFRLSLSKNCFRCCELWMEYINRKKTILGHTESILGNTLTDMCTKYNWDMENIIQSINAEALFIIKQFKIRFARVPDDEGNIERTILSVFDKEIGGLCRTRVFIPFLTQVALHMKESCFNWHSSLSLTSKVE